MKPSTVTNMSEEELAEVGVDEHTHKGSKIIEDLDGIKYEAYVDVLRIGDRTITVYTDKQLAKVFPDEREFVLSELKIHAGMLREKIGG